jgi:hypothetical protein
METSLIDTRVYMPKFVVLGTGPAGLFAADWISREITSDVVAVGSKTMGTLRPAHIEGRMTTILPIFPQRGQEFPEIGYEGPALTTVHVGAAEMPECEADPAPLSYAARAMREFAPASLSLAWKQFGRRIWHEPLLEVQRKVERSYGAAGTTMTGRLGYVRGESPYAHVLRRVMDRVRVVNATPMSIYDRRCLVLDDRTRLPYEYVVNTLPLHAIARVLEVPDPGGTFAGTEFAVARIEPTASNRLVYDLDAQSPIFRVLTPHTDIAIAQLSMSCGQISRQALRARLECLLGVPVLGLYPRWFSFPLSYPLDPPGPGAMRAFESICEFNRVVNLGRFAEWRYIDLHEISWKERLRCV